MAPEISTENDCNLFFNLLNTLITHGDSLWARKGSTFKILKSGKSKTWIILNPGKPILEQLQSGYPKNIDTLQMMKRIEPYIDPAANQNVPIRKLEARICCWFQIS